MNILITGIQGSGKGTHGKLIAESFNLQHISFGDSIKLFLTNEPDFVLPYTLEKYNNGELAPDKVLFKIAKRIIPINSTKYDGFILDGFPRTIGQLNFIKKNYNIDLCIKLTLSDEDAILRLLKRKRSDDTMESIQNRIIQYHKITEPCFKSFEIDNKILNINTNNSIDKISKLIINKIKMYDTSK